MFHTAVLNNLTHKRIRNPFKEAFTSQKFLKFRFNCLPCSEFRCNFKDEEIKRKSFSQTLPKRKAKKRKENHYERKLKRDKNQVYLNVKQMKKENEKLPSNSPSSWVCFSAHPQETRHTISLSFAWTNDCEAILPLFLNCLPWGWLYKPARRGDESREWFIDFAIHFRYTSPAL